MRRPKKSDYPFGWEYDKRRGSREYWLGLIVELLLIITQIAVGLGLIAWSASEMLRWLP